MIQSGKLAQMADGIHVLGDTIQDLALNYIEVLNRADKSGLTFKPSKAIICPRNINLFGWDLRGEKWYPTSHTVSALTDANKPTTVKQLRSFLGSLKQLSSSLPNYAVVIHSLEQIVAGKKSAERITWTQQLDDSFVAAKQLAANPIGITEPRPDDCLRTYSDYSAENRAVGGRLVIVRNTQEGKPVELIGGFFSVVLNKHKKNWLPCEGEAAGVRLVLEHFQHHIRESQNITIHYTDSQPCVLAWKRSQRGAFSSSSRIATFLTGLSALPVELHYKPGKLMHTSDYASRHPPSCNSRRCQICQFVKDWEHIGDNASSIRSVLLEDIKAGRTVMPLTQRKVWRNIQKKDPIHCKLADLILTQQLPESRKRKGDYTKLKLLHNLYTQGKLFIDTDGTILVKSPDGNFNGSVLSIPPSLYPGVANAIHIRLDHPSRTQLSSLISRYFYTPGWRAIIDDISEKCHQCAAVKKLPKVLLENSTAIPSGIATNFAADVIERSTQKILVVRENLSQYTRATIIPDQKSGTLRDALASMILDLIPDTGTEVRVDAATAFQALKRESEMNDSLLKKLNIKIVVGRILNKNKNPTAENTNKEVLKEILRLTNKPGAISQTELNMVLRNVNSRIRYNKLSPKEILFRRDALTNAPLNVDDDSIAQKQALNRSKSSIQSQTTKLGSHKATEEQLFQVGDLVFLRESLDKNNPRELFIIEDWETYNGKTYFLIRKLKQSLRERLYRTLPDEIIHVPTHDSNTPDNPEKLNKLGRPYRKAALKAKESLNVYATSNKSPLKYGWLSEDQDYDTDIFPLPLYDTPHDTPPSMENLDNTCDLSWDSSSEQYELTPDPVDLNLTYSVLPRDLFNEAPDQQIEITNDMDEHYPQQNTFRQRCFAVSDQPVMRSNAFRDPTQALNEARITPSDVDEDMVLDDAIQSTSENLLKLIDSPEKVNPKNTSTPRIPMPVSPSSVQLHQVTDVSIVAHEALRRLSNHNSPTRERQEASRPRRNVKAPSDYKTFHNKGQF